MEYTMKYNKIDFVSSFYKLTNKMIYEIDKNDNRLLVVRFKNKNTMNTALSKISERYEGLSGNAEGHNFPVSYIEKSDIIYDFVKKIK